MNETKTSRYSEAEYGVLKSLLKDNDELLYLARKIFLFGGLTEAEIAQAKEAFGRGELHSILKKTFLPEISNDDPITQVTDLWAMVNLENKMPEEVEVEIQARKRVNEMLSDALKRLQEPTSEKIDLTAYSPSEDPTENHIALKARNLFINGMTIQFANLRLMARRESENPDEAEKRKNQNSSK